MPLTNAGRDWIAAAIVGESVTPFDATNAYIGVGDSTTAFDPTQTDLQALTNKIRKGMESGYPDRTDNVLTFRAVFTTEEANWSWQEWGVFNAASGGVMLLRVVEDLGTKTSAHSWQFTVDITISVS